MATDLYAKCPCGSGKKIKFCCKDIITDIERIERMLQGEQRTSALEKINKLLQKHPDRPALLSLRAQVYLELENLDEANSTLDRLLEVEEDNPSALAMKASLRAAEGDTQESLRLLHRSLRVSSGVLSQIVYRSYLAICMHLIRTEQLVSAYAHLLTLVSITRGQDRNSVSMLMQVTSSDRLPAIFHGLLITDTAPEAAMWKREFDVAIDMYRHGDWTEAASLLESMSKRILDEPVILRNQAILQAWIAQEEKAIKAFRYYSAIRDVDEHLAVEAEACAQVLDASHEDDSDELVAITQDIEDAEALMERLLSADSVDSIPVQRNPNSDSPPPKGQFVIFDRDLPSTSAEPEEGDAEKQAEAVNIDELPREMCSATLFGKETDRSARITVIGFKDEKFENWLKIANEATGQKFSPDAESETVGRVHRVERIFRPNFRVPPKTSVEAYKTVQRDWIVQQLETAWANLALSQFDGKSAAEAATEKKKHRKVLAAILNLELWSDRQPFEFDFDKLRTTLNLPANPKIDPTEINIRSLSTTQIRCLELDKLTDDDLKFIFEVVSVRPNGSLLFRIGQEVLNRPSMTEKIDLVEVHERMADLAPTSDGQLEHMSKARDLAVSKGESPASWLVAELDLRIQRGESDAAKRLISEIQTRYLKEPGVAQMFAQVLTKYGLMPQTPGGMPPAAMPGGMPMGPGEGVPAEVGAGAPAAADGVWTPDGPASSSAPAEEGGEKSKLWLPD